MTVPAGTRATVRQRLLEPRERTASLPEDTAGLPYEIVIRGILVEAAAIGEQAVVKTAAGRLVTGIVDEIEPADEHTFGRPVTALVAADKAISELVGSRNA